MRSPGALRWPLIAAIYVAVWLLAERLAFPVRRDEVHFWPTALRFSERLVPDLELLRDYGELNTPLPFLLWGWLEHLFHGGIELGRHVNLALSAAMTCLIARARPGREWQGALAALGVLLFPYYLGTATHLYTDVLAAFFALLGVHWHLGRRYGLAALAFILGIASRQYIVAFPAALLVLALLDARAGRPQGKQAAAWLFAACLSLLGWFALFGGFAPPGETARQEVATAAVRTIYVDHALFALTMVGLYYAVPELLLFRGTLAPLRDRSRAALAVAAVLALAFVAFPPLGNVVIIESFGYTDIAVRRVLPDAARVALYCALAIFGVVRFLREPMPLLLVLSNAALMLKAHVAWEKYALPLLVLLWYLRSRGLAGTPRVASA